MCDCWFSCNGCNRGYVPNITDVFDCPSKEERELMSEGVRLFKNRNVWLRKHNQRKFNQRMKWYEEMEKTGEMPDAMIQDMQDAAHRNAGHEPEPACNKRWTRMEVMSQPGTSFLYRTDAGLSFLNHPPGWDNSLI